MKKKLVFAIIFVLMFIFNIKIGINTIKADSNELIKIKFEDKNLYNLVKSQILLKSSNDNELTIEVSEEDIKNFESLKCEGEAIKSIKGIEYFKNLTSLNLSDNEGLTDFSPISSLTNLSYLDLEKTDFENLDVLSNLSNLKELDISYSNITDLKGIEHLTNLKELIFSDCLLGEDDVDTLNNIIKNNQNLEYIYGGINITEDTFRLPDIFMDEEITDDLFELTEDKTKYIFERNSLINDVEIEEGKYKNSTIHVQKVDKDYIKNKLKESKNNSFNTSSNQFTFYIIVSITIISLVLFIILIKKKIVNSKIFLIIAGIIILLFVILSIYFGIKTFYKNTNTKDSQNNDNMIGASDSTNEIKAININGYDVYLGRTSYNEFINNTKFNQVKIKKGYNYEESEAYFNAYVSDGYSIIRINVKNNVVDTIRFGNIKFYDNENINFDSAHTTITLPKGIKIGDSIDKVNETYISEDEKGNIFNDSTYKTWLSLDFFGDELKLYLYIDNESGLIGEVLAGKSIF